jgi:hypothetical protein
MNIRSTYNPESLDLSFQYLKQDRKRYLRFKHIKTSVKSVTESYVFAKRAALAGPIGKLP